MPDWLIQQFPIVAVILFATWRAEKRVGAKEVRLEERADRQQKAAIEREDQLRKEAREDRDAEIKRYQELGRAAAEANEKLLAAKDGQIAGLTGELERLRKEVAALAKKLSG